ncbi:otogelin-like protein isoform X3 [Harpia harpyja]|uniref:otogelin-like protein isoform X3 n=1 Tax=Harpia harpyja TaxID=202280 RepID=UPI0022B202B6|nr:otogelin-like protein isoform X3 [Harpia harpyja]
MNIVGKLNLMIPWSIFLLHSLLSSLQGSYCKLSLLRRNSRNEFNATRQKRDLVTAEIQAASPRLHLHGALTRSLPGGSCPQECLNGAVCTEAGDCDCELFQAQGSRCQIVPNTGKDRDGICKSWGQYHFETFDGIYYYFPGNCSYIFAKDCSSPEPQYTVWVHNSPHCYGSVYTCQRSVSLFFSNQEEIIISGHEVRKDGIKLMLPQTVGNAFLERLADYILVKTTFGFSLAWDGNSGIYIKLTEDHKGKPCGLCGNFNGNKYDDLILQNIGEYTEDIAEFANSWAVQTSDDIACVPTASDFSSPCPADAEFTEDIFYKCQIFLQFPFLSCHESIDPYSYISSCMNDLCRVDDDETYCRAVTEYARACSHAGSPVRDWRDDFPACTEKCEDSFVHRDCISCCPPTCTFEKDCLGSNLHCLDGCYCPDGLIMENGTCISVSNCPCIYHGTAFPVGSKIEQECSNCICIGGIWNCTDHDCPAECSIIGSSHFTTFDGRHFTFLGICQYILVKGTGKNKFTITLQKAPCGQNFDHACIESITLVLEDDVSKQLTLTRYGQVQTGPNQVFNLNGAIEIQNISSFFVQLKTSFGLKILFAKDGERIYVQVDVGWKRRTLGLCGTYNGNLRDDFLSPAGMIEGTPQLHANAWKVSSACSVPINIPVVDPCNVNQQNAGYASHCDIINQEVFAPCHAYISPGLYYQLCRFDACKCGSSCLCNALAHYAYVCSKHGVIVDFRSHISYCAVMCHSGMLYHQCSSFCKHSCASLSMANICGDDCAEGCNCPDGKYFEESVNFCVSISACHCHYKGKALQPGEILPTPTGSCQCLNGTVKCIEATTENTVHICPEGKIYYDCRSPVPGLPAAGVNCGISCANLAMNFSCVPSPPCASGCICPPGMAEHRGKCYIPDSCPCTWKDREFLSGEVIATPCYTCVCRRGIFNCTSYPCPAVCTIYGDRHYYTFDGLEYDYVSDCQAYLLKSTDNSNISIIAQNKKCFDNDIVCSKNVFITVGDTEIYFSEPSEKQTLRGQENKSNYQLWKAGYYTVIHFPEQDITILWDKKTMIHVKVGPRWKGKLAGLCGNFDKYTSNDLTTSNNMEVRNAQVFGDSWVLGQCKSPNETLRPCEVHQSKFPYAKKECSILYSDVFAPCRNVIDVTSFVKNCHTDTCNCNLGGDCECLCTSIAAYAHKCCQQGAAIHWRSPSLCAYDCEYYNQGLGEGPYVLASYGENDTIIGANVSTRRIFPLPRTGAHGNVFFSFMITPGLFKDKDLSLSLVSLESAERPNYFLYVHDNETVGLEQWQASASFRRRATFFHHQGLWTPGLSAFELHSKKGFFIILTSSGVKVAKYDDSEEFKRLSTFNIEELGASVPYRRLCEWRYESCANPCVKTCSDPEGIACKFLPPVEGCLPYCPKNMILDEVTLKCVYLEDCIPVTPTESAIETKPSLLISHTGATTERFPQTPPLFVTSGTESTHTGVTAKITMKANITLMGMNMSAQPLTDFHSLEASNAATYSTFSLPSTVEPSDVLHSTASPTVLSKLISSTDFPTALQASAATSRTVSSTASITLPITIATPTILLSASPIPTRSALLTPTSLLVVPFPLETSITQLGTVPPTSALKALTFEPSFVTSELPAGIGKSRSPPVSHSKGATVSSKVSLSAFLAGRATFTRPVFLLGSQLTLSTSTSPISTLSVKTRSGTGQTAVHPAPISALTLTAPQIPMTTRFDSFEASFPQLTTASYFETAKPLSKTSLISLNASSLASFSPKPFLSSVEISVTVPKQTSPLIKDSISAALPVTTVSSPQSASQIPINTSSSPSVTHTLSVPVHSLITSLKPKTMADVSVTSKSLYKIPSTASALLVNPTISDMSIASKASTENKYIMDTDSSSVSSISEKPRKSISSTVFPLRTLVLPPNATLITTSEITEYPSSSRRELKTDPVAQSSGTFIPKDPSLTRSSSLFTILLSTSVPSYVTSLPTSSSLIPIVSRTSSLTQNITATQTPVSSLDRQGTSESPVIDFANSSVDFSTFTLNISPSTSLSAVQKASIRMPSLLTPTIPEATLENQPSRVPMSSPPPKTTRISTVSLGKQSSSVSSSEEDGTISAISAGIITQSTTPMITNTTVNATSLKAPYIFAKIPPSSSASLLVASGTTVASRITTKTTDSFVADLEFYMASASVPTTAETLMHVSHESLFTSAASQTSQSTTETPQMMITKTTGTTSPLSQMKSTSFTASEVKYATSFERTVAILESGQTSHEQRNVTKTKSTTTEKSSLPYLTVSAVQSSPFSRNTTSGKNLFLSGVLDVTTSDWSKISTQKTIKPYFSLTEPTELQTRTITDLAHSSGGIALPSSAEPVETQTSLASTGTMTATADKSSFGTMMHTLMSTSSECVPRYLEPVDKCSQYVCVNAGWMLYNLSRNCPKDVQKPDCGFRGMPVQVNADSCCPEWECPCQCSVLSELSVITFDGNNIALCNMASYILVKLPGETIVAHIEKCPANQSANSIRKLVPPASASGLCFKKLNVTTRTYKLLINRLARKVVVDSVIQSLPFSKEGLSIQDTGAMYVINTPAGISIKWAHVTGIIDIQYGLHSNTSMKTEGLCGVCNGDPTDDLKMQNRTIITNMEETEVFIKSWEIEKSLDVTTRRPVRNCTEDNCTYCMELLNRSIFIPCHKKVSPQEFCEKMWINSTYFWNYECDALSAYVALCNKHNICIKWRTPDYCSLSCPEGKEYQPCVQPCEAKTCLNKWFYEDSPCSYLREDCVCKNGTILHRTDSDLCIPEEKCTCTDNKGQPRSAGEIWNGSMRGCCMYNCLENGSIVAVEPECNEDPPPVCEREGEVIIHVIEERACCPKKVCECNMSLCDAIIPTCKPNEKLAVGYHPLSCCPQYRCECDPSVCFNASQLDCREDQFIVEAKQENPCCFSYVCVCESCIEPVPLCNEGEILTVDLNTIHYCCPHYYCVCDENLCPEPPMNCTDDMTLVKEKIPGQCCPEWHCECSCENATMLTCKLGEVKKIDSVSSACGCTHYICEKDDVCIFQEVTVLNPGQSVIQYLDGDLCYTVQCLQERDQNTGYNAMHFTMVNCSQQCEAHQIYIPSSSHHTCCGTCQNVSCSFHTENGTLIVYEEGSTWSSNCTNYKCAKTAAGAMILGSSVVCPPFNDTECTKNGGIVQTYNDGCCKTCSGLGLLPFAISPVVPTDSINCEPGKKEERICQKMTIRTTIRKNDCISQSPINVASCDGKCPSATIFNVNIDSHLRFCKCCRENGTRNLTVPLRCSGNGTEIMYVIQEPIDCSCQWN